ncbi:unnamed protein product [Paramecium octaurelia]|uniref:Uncharacterized protein n=1 Tax=Paramecium octaurelia TaxID=43137 RepID=A0A8S1XAA9_PAROT|nr:unnamed protein product [Paramecium octaurelia]
MNQFKTKPIMSKKNSTPISWTQLNSQLLSIQNIDENNHQKMITFYTTNHHGCNELLWLLSRICC